MPYLFSKLRAANIARHKVWPGAGESDLAFSCIEFSGEVGELQECYAKLLEIAFGSQDQSQYDSVHADATDEMGDVLISLDLLARDLDVSITVEWDDTVKPDPNAGLWFGAAAGRVADDVKKLLRIRRGIAGNKNVTEETLIARAADDINKAAHWALRVAMNLSVDPAAAVSRKFNKTSTKVGVPCFMDHKTLEWYHSSCEQPR